MGQLKLMNVNGFPFTLHETPLAKEMVNIRWKRLPVSFQRRKIQSDRKSNKGGIMRVRNRVNSICWCRHWRFGAAVAQASKTNHHSQFKVYSSNEGRLDLNNDYCRRWWPNSWRRHAIHRMVRAKRTISTPENSSVDIIRL